MDVVVVVAADESTERVRESILVGRLVNVLDFSQPIPERRPLKRRVLKQGALKLSRPQRRALQLRTIQHRALHPCMFERRPLQLRLYKCRALKLRILEQRALQQRPMEPSTLNYFRPFEPATGKF